jgi:hypothetical protein
MRTSLFVTLILLTTSCAATKEIVERLASEEALAAGRDVVEGAASLAIGDYARGAALVASGIVTTALILFGAKKIKKKPNATP